MKDVDEDEWWMMMLKIMMMMQSNFYYVSPSRNLHGSRSARSGGILLVLEPPSLDCLWLGRLELGSEDILLLRVSELV
jgi:hypothetical protein